MPAPQAAATTANHFVFHVRCADGALAAAGVRLPDAATAGSDGTADAPVSFARRWLADDPVAQVPLPPPRREAPTRRERLAAQ